MSAEVKNLSASIRQRLKNKSVVSEKFEAMVKLGGGNSRMKDFFDLWLLSQQFTFRAPELCEAVRATFERRGTAIDGLPVTLDPALPRIGEKQVQWAAFLRRSRIENAPPHFADVAASLAAFVGPVAEALAQGTSLSAAWTPGGPWGTL